MKDHKSIPLTKSIVSDQVFRLLVEAVTDYAIFLLDKEGTILTWNRGAERLKGYTADEIIGRSFKMFYTTDDLLRQHPEHELEIAKDVGRYEEEGWRLRKDGRRFWANIIINKLLDENNNFIGFSKITRDLTERKFAEEKLRQSEERFRLLVNNVEDYAIITLDKEGFVQTWNTGAYKIKGYNADEIIGRSYHVFYSPEDIKAGKPDLEMHEVRAHGRFEDEGWRVKKDGTKFWANVIMTALKNEAGEITGYSKITRDLSERRKVEEALKVTNLNLEEKVKKRTFDLEKALTAKDQFISIASHELNTPLTTLKMQTQMRMKRLEKSSENPSKEILVKYFNDDLRQINRLVHLVEDILEISRINTGKLILKKAPCALNDLLQDLSTRFASQLEQNNIHFDLILPTKRLEGIWDGFRVEQVFSNILSNAIKYGSGNPITITLEQDGDLAVTRFIDQGIGIEEKDFDRIFGQFERAISASEISGMGVGLFISKQIIEAHNGRIRVQSIPGKGSTFTVDLPLP